MERAPQASVGLRLPAAVFADRLPLHVRRLLLHGDPDPDTVSLFHAGWREIHVLRPGRTEADSNGHSPAATAAGPDFSRYGSEVVLPSASFDGVVLLDTQTDEAELLSLLSAAMAMCTRVGVVAAAALNAGHRAHRSAGIGVLRDHLVEQCRRVGLEVYHEWDITDAAAPPVRNGAACVGDRTYPVRSPEEARDLVVVAQIYLIVPDSYDPVAHARDLYTAGRPGAAYRVLRDIPPVYLQEDAVAALVAAETAACLVKWDSQLQDGESLHRFHLVQSLFFDATSKAPTLHQAYHCVAEFWHRIGDDDMARRVLNTIQHIAPTGVTADQRAGYRRLGPRPRADETPPEWRLSGVPPRVLLVTSRRIDYGLDVLYDGLCTVLGADGVIEYPWKPTLHGGTAPDFAYYPCLFDHATGFWALDHVLDAVRSAHFDVVLFGDAEGTVDHEAARRIVTETPKATPIYVVDMLDVFTNVRPEIEQRLGFTAAGCLKREKLRCVDYGSDCYPLPFAYAERYIPNRVPIVRTMDVFWAGNRRYGSRKLIMEALERGFGLDFSTLYLPSEYVACLAAARIGLDLPGFGFDTVRYWEVPAHGAMLLAERRPTVIPYDFEHERSAVFFDDLPDLERTLRRCLAAPEECVAIAQRGRARLLAHHTASSRARHLLGWIGA